MAALPPNLAFRSRPRPAPCAAAPRTTVIEPGHRASRLVLYVLVCVAVVLGAVTVWAPAVSGAPAQPGVKTGRAVKSIQAVKTGQAVQAPAKVVPRRAMWVWNWDDNSEVVRFAATNGVSELLVYLYPGWSLNPDLSAKVTDLVGQARRAGLVTTAMGGDPSWVTQPSVATAWVREAAASTMFSGIHLEIEPHSVPGFWDSRQDQDRLIRSYLQLLDGSVAAARPLPVELSLPWWFFTLYDPDTGSRLDAAAISRVSSVAIITFADTVEMIEFDARVTAGAATAAHRPFRFAAETNPVDPEWVSFSGQTSSSMLAALGTVDAHWSSNPLYVAGFAVEEFKGWSAMSP